MEDSKSISGVEQPGVNFTAAYLRPRHVPDVPEDVDHEFMMEHLNDPNMDISKKPSSHFGMELEKKLGYSSSDIDTESRFSSDRYSTDRAESRNSTAIDFDDESPYPEVRAAVASVDDPLMPVNTIRMWMLGIFLSVLVSSANQLLVFRYPSVFVTGIVMQLVALPCGKFLEWILPAWTINILGMSLALNPGPFNVKEHVCITVMTNISVGGVYATDVLASQQLFYGQTFGYGYAILLSLGTQTAGYALAGYLRQFLVWPSSMIWPGALVNSALFNTLHKNYRKGDRGHMSREKFFLCVFVGSFVWYFVPGFLFTALSFFNWICWIVPTNIPVNVMFGTASGLGLSVLTFDWAMVAYLGSPLVTPWWAEANTAVALVICFWIAVPIMYFTNAMNTAFLPISSFLGFDNTGLPYDPSAVVTNSLFDVEKYKAYSPVFLPATLCMAYGIAFAAFTSVIVHTFLWFRRDIARRFRGSLKDERDVHSRLMQAYPEVPAWWYGLVGVISVAFTLIAIEIFPTQLPIWGALFAFALSAILCLPVGIIQAITNQPVTLQVMHELIAGYILPGRPIANTIFKTIAFTCTTQAVGFAGDLKLGHYMKVPPRMMFLVQVVAVIVTCFVSTGVQTLLLNNIVDICQPDQPQGFICPSTNTFATASIIWGAVGPKRLFSPGAPYSGLLWFFAVGAILPVPFYLLARRYPLSFWRFINIPVFFAGVSAIPPASGINYTAWVAVGFLFNFYIRRNHFRWWMRYNYILSAGLDAGVAVALVIIFLCIQLPGGQLNWWGNTVWQNTADAMGLPFKMPEGPIFGPSTWE